MIGSHAAVQWMVYLFQIYLAYGHIRHNECPSGYIVGRSATGRSDGYCLLFVDSFNSWYDAMMDCETRGGQLPQVSNIQLQNQLFDLASKRAKKCTRYWVGGTKEVMSSGSRRLSYYQRTCAYLSTVRIRDKINDYYSCESPSMACHVCQVSARPWCPEGTVPMPVGCVEFIDEAMTWQEASDTCADKRGRLPIVKDDEDINLLKALRSKYGRANLPIWIGAEYLEDRGFFSVDRRRLRSELFGPGRPRTPVKPDTCVLLPGRRSVRLVEESCATPQRFMCIMAHP